MSTQVVRVEGFSKGSLTAIGLEAERGDVQHRNPDIDSGAKDLNLVFKKTSDGFYREWNDLKTSLNAQFRETKASIAFEGMVITADKEFFKDLGWEKGKPLPAEVKKFFKESYDFAVREVGYLGTSKNIISAIVHADETTPHLQLYYLPVTEKWQNKVLERDAEGKVLRDERGNTRQAKDEFGKSLFAGFEDRSAPKLSKSDFWRVRGGQSSYRLMQDRFHEDVGLKYGLQRGQVNSDRQHLTKSQWEAENLKKEVQPYRDLKVDMTDIDKIGKKILPGTVLVKEKDLVVLQEQAKALTVNAPELQSVRERSAELDEKETVLQEKEKDLEDLKDHVMGMYDLQIDLNTAFKELKVKNSTLKAENCDLRAENNRLQLCIGHLESKVADLKKGIKDVFCAFNFFRVNDDRYSLPLKEEHNNLFKGLERFVGRFFKDKGDEKDVAELGSMAKITSEVSSCIKLASHPDQNQDPAHGHGRAARQEENVIE